MAVILASLIGVASPFFANSAPMPWASFLTGAVLSSLAREVWPSAPSLHMYIVFGVGVSIPYACAGRGFSLWRPASKRYQGTARRMAITMLTILVFEIGLAILHPLECKVETNSRSSGVESPSPGSVRPNGIYDGDKKAPSPPDRWVDHRNWEKNDIGLPPPLKIKTAEFCHLNRMSLIDKDGYKCSEDESCVECADPLHYNNTITQFRIWKNPKLQEEFEEVFQYLVEGEPVVIQALNKGQVHLWLNWVCSCDYYKIPIRHQTILFATDYDTYKIAKEADFLVLEPTWSKTFKIDPVWGGQQAHRGHRFVNNFQMLLAKRLLARGHDVLCMDVDFIWMQDPIPFLKSLGDVSDILASLAPRWDSKGTANTGFMYLRNTPRTHLFVDSVINLMPIKGPSDQMLVNSVLRHYKMRQIRLTILPKSVISLLHKRTSFEHSLVIHCVSSWKSQRLNAAGLMFFNETCPLYHESLNPCAGNLTVCKL